MYHDSKMLEKMVVFGFFQVFRKNFCACYLIGKIQWWDICTVLNETFILF